MMDSFSDTDSSTTCAFHQATRQIGSDRLALHASRLHSLNLTAETSVPSPPLADAKHLALNFPMAPVSTAFPDFNPKVVRRHSWHHLFLVVKRKLLRLSKSISLKSLSISFEKENTHV